MGGECSPIIVVDLDGTLAKYERFKGIEIIDAPEPRTVELLKRLHVEGWIIKIFTCRTNKWNIDRHGYLPYHIVKTWLKLHEIPYDDVVRHDEGKPFADVHLDDRAVMFNDMLSVEGLYRLCVGTLKPNIGQDTYD